jgi:multiple sugar transport system substrate-binding protein
MLARPRTPRAVDVSAPAPRGRGAPECQALLGPAEGEDVLEPTSDGAGLTRRKLLATGVTAGAALALGGCGGTKRRIPRSGGDPWRRFAGTTLNFISENTSPTSAIAANLKPFTDRTGINVNIVQLELSAMVQKVALDFASGLGAYQVVYADPYQVLAPYHKALADLNDFNQDPGLPHVHDLHDFIPVQLEAAGRFADPHKLYCLPYDCPTMLWFYRKDLFAKYGRRMRKDLGFDPTPGSDRSWEQYFRMAEWFNRHAKGDVPYGTGHMAKEHDSLMNDFSNVLWAFGGDWFHNGRKVGGLGVTDPGPTTLNTPEARRAADFYNRLIGIAHPASKGWDWTGAEEGFLAGQMAMAPLWHEDAADAEASKYKGKIGYALLPHGPRRSANMYGGTGLGINGTSPKDEQRAAWLFLVWATSKQTQLADLKSKAGGGTPTRQSVYDLPEVRKARKPPSKLPNILTYDAVSQAWKPENIGLRPKIPAWNECDTTIFSNFSKMLAGSQTPEQTLQACSTGIRQAIANSKSLEAA